MSTEQAASLVTRVLASTEQAVHAPWAPQPSQMAWFTPARPASPLCWVLISIPKHARAQSPLAASLSRLSLLSFSSTEGTQVTTPDGNLASAADCRSSMGGRVKAGHRVMPALPCPPHPHVPPPGPFSRTSGEEGVCVRLCACVMRSTEDKGRR